MAETIFKQVSLRRLFPDEAQRAPKQKEKEGYDLDYEKAIQKLSGDYYTRKRSVGVDKKEEKAYQEKKVWCWNLYQITAVTAGLWQEVDKEKE
jgi:hypothetical protein